MPKRTSYVQGTPNWIDLQTPDLATAKTFYAAVFGWTYDDQPIPGGGSYTMAHLRDDQVAGMMEQSPDMAAQAPPAWQTYLAVDDVDAAAAKVVPNDGQLIMPATDVMDAGRFVFVIDPGGAPVAFWQAKGHAGASLVNEPGAFIWNELITTKPAETQAFYRAVLGLTTTTTEMDGQPYTMFVAGDAQIAGTIPPPMEGVPSQWHVYFAVDDVAATVERVKEAGGAVVNGPFETPIGPMAVVADPTGAAFSVMQPPPAT